MGSEVLVPVRRCPFYGQHFSERMRLFVGHEGNQCGLITSSYSPCKMEVEGLQVDWNKCPLNNMENSERFNSALEHATEIQKDSPTSVSFKSFYSEVMGQR